MSDQKIEIGTTALDAKSSDLKCSLEYSANTPLWKRVPKKDETGQYLGDFMMIIPSLKKATPEDRKYILNVLTKIIELYADTIVFADLNMKMSLLWISLKPIKGMMIEIPSAIMEAIPGAKLISDRPASY